MTTSHADKFRAAQADAALTEMEAQRAFERHLEDVLDIARSPRQRLLEVIRVGDDAVVSITGLAGETLWGAVVDDKRPPTYVYTQDEALVHLVSLRHDERNSQAYRYACRTLNVPVRD